MLPSEFWSLDTRRPMTVSRASLLVNSDACSNGQRCISPLPGYFDSGAESQSDADLNTTTSAFSVFDNELYTSVDNLQGEGYATVDTVNQPFTAENVTFALTSNVSSSFSNKDVQQNRHRSDPNHVAFRSGIFNHSVIIQRRCRLSEVMIIIWTRVFGAKFQMQESNGQIAKFHQDSADRGKK